MQEAATKIGVDPKKVKISNHSKRSTAVSHLARKGVSENEPYLQLDKDHHGEEILQNP
jgi:hypothetical protein